MLVDADAVEADILGVDQLVEVAVVQLTAQLRVVETVRAGDPGRPVVVVRECRVRHQVEAEEPHRLAPCESGSECVASTTVWMPPLTSQSVRTVARRGSIAATRSSRMRLVTSSWNT